MHDSELIEEQIAYYAETAPEYYEITTPPGDSFERHGHAIVQALHNFRPSGNVLEIACGTGNATKHLLEHADAITALDSSEPSIEISRRRLGNDLRINYVVADVFAWEPQERYDAVVFSYWISHVPPSRFEAFWALVARALKPGGRVFFCDEREDAWRMEEQLHEEFIDHPSVPLVRRPAGEGKSYRVIKIFWNPEELRARLRELGWDVETGSSGPFFWGVGTRS